MKKDGLHWIKVESKDGIDQVFSAIEHANFFVDIRFNHFSNRTFVNFKVRPNVNYTILPLVLALSSMPILIIGLVELKVMDKVGWPDFQ
ncbi:MAG: hypothetical protein HKN76_16100 [Saprospiraceae bacterium]|nr:hypothetical protein [Saprospiraceae bacterium]